MNRGCIRLRSCAKLTFVNIHFHSMRAKGRIIVIITSASRGEANPPLRFALNSTW